MISCKLDHALVNTHWLIEDFRGYADFLAPGCLSNHSSYVILLLQDVQHVQQSFKFYNMWALH